MVDIATSSEPAINQISSLLGDHLKRQDESPVAEEPETVESEETPELDENPDIESQSSDASEEPDESQEQGIESLNNLAEELEVPIEDMYALAVNISKSEAFPDGGNVTLGELKDFYTKNVNIDQEREALKQKEQDLQAQAEQVSDVPKISNELLQARAQVLAIQDAYNRTDWNGLRHTNQAEYAALQQDFRMQFEAAKHQEMVATQQFEDHQLETMRIQQERLFEVMPELKDEETAKNIAQQVTNFAARYGITAKEVDAVTDHRVMRMLIESSRSDATKVKAKAKQVEKKAPKATKPTTKSIPSRKASLKRLTERAKSSNLTKDKVDAIRNLIT